MRIAVMQPYLFPYIGYFQLISTVDIFLFFDDVNFITQGYIHRNAIELNNTKSVFTVPLSGASQNSLISEVKIHLHEYEKWWRKFQKSLEQEYRSAPCYGNTMNMLAKVFDEPPATISALAQKSIRAACEHMGLVMDFKSTSSMDYDKGGSAQDKVLSICKILGADTYINPIGGVELYHQEDFKTNNLELYFLLSENISYSQKKEPFISSLSIIDVLMYNDRSSIKDFLKQYELVKKEQL